MAPTRREQAGERIEWPGAGETPDTTPSSPWPAVSSSPQFGDADPSDAAVMPLGLAVLPVVTSDESPQHDGGDLDDLFGDDVDGPEPLAAPVLAAPVLAAPVLAAPVLAAPLEGLGIAESSQAWPGLATTTTGAMGSAYGTASTEDDLAPAPTAPFGSGVGSTPSLSDTGVGTPSAALEVGPTDDVSLDDLFGDPDPAPLPTLEQLTTLAPTAPPAPAAAPMAPVAPSGDDLLPVITGQSTTGPSLAALAGLEMPVEDRAPVITQRVSPSHARAEVAAQLAPLFARFARYADLWPVVDKITAMIASVGELQPMVAEFILTRDHARDNAQRAELEARISPYFLQNNIRITNPRDSSVLFDMVYDELVGISVLGPFWREDSVTEIMVNGFDDVTIEIGSEVVVTPLVFRDKNHVGKVSRELARKISDRGLSRSNPIVTAELPGARVTLVTDPVVRKGTSINLRKFIPLFGMAKLLEFGSLNVEMAEFLQESVAARATVLISGGTGTGKTTLINALSEFIPPTERVVTIEDAFELSLANAHVVALQTKERASADDTIVVTQADLLIAALRMRPDRIVVGEIREGEGALVMLQAANTGHDGTMTTIHANTAETALNERMVDLVREASSRPDDVAKRSVATALDLVVQVTRRRGRRFVSEISVIDLTSMSEGRIAPEPVFTGELGPDGSVVFSRVGEVRPDTELGRKIADHQAMVAEDMRGIS